MSFTNFTYFIRLVFTRLLEAKVVIFIHVASSMSSVLAK